MSQDLKKQDLIDSVSSTVGLSKTNAKQVVDVVFDSITQALVGGGSVQLQNFGKFAIAQRAARTGVNPSTGEKIEIAASATVSFKVSSALKEVVNTANKKKSKK